MGATPDCLAPYPNTQTVYAGNIVVPVGNRSEDYTHVIEKHATKIAGLHNGMSAGDYILNIFRHFQEIYRQADGSLVLLRTNGVRKCAVVAPLLVGGVLVYKLITAYPLPRKPDYGRRGAVRLNYR
jgi:hypothetical protein